MTARLANDRHLPPHASSMRRGIAGAWLMVAFAALATVAALVINVGWMYAQRNRLQTACEAAALAGAPLLIDDSFLYRRGPVQPAGSASAEDEAAAELAERRRRALEEAARFAAVNGLLLDVLERDENESVTAVGVDDLDRLAAGADAAAASTGGTHGKGEATFWIGASGLGGRDDTSQSPAPETGGGDEAPQAEEPAPPGVQGMVVRAGKDKSRGNALTLWLGGVTGVTKGSVAAEAGAVLDQRIHGFRPVNDAPVPMVPLAISATARSTAWFRGALLGAADPAGLKDEFAVDSKTGEVAAGADGIPEITLLVRASDSSQTVGSGEQSELEEGAKWVWLGGSEPDFETLVRQVEAGLTAGDLNALGGEIRLGEDGVLTIPGAPAANAAQLTLMRRALLAIRGQVRVWPLGDAVTVGGGSATRIVGFVAGCVVDCQQDAGSGLLVTVEPRVLVTSTSLVGGGKALNPFLGKVMLDR